MDITEIRYIVLLTDDRADDHDGRVFSDFQAAQDYVRDNLDDYPKASPGRLRKSSAHCFNLTH